MATNDFDRWYRGLEERHMADLTFAEVRRAVQALSMAYVSRSEQKVGDALDGAGKRAAFAMFYGPLHFLTVQTLVRELDIGRGPLERIVDLGCGTGVAGAAWSLESASRPEVLGIERNSWAAREARWNYRALGVRGRVRSADLNRVRLPGQNSAILLAWAANELDDTARRTLLERLVDASGRGAAVLIVEPIARRVTPWWDGWVDRLSAQGGRATDWRFRDLIGREALELMDRAAGLDHRELTARSIWVR